MSVTPFPLERARASAIADGPGRRFTEADRAVLAPVHHLIAGLDLGQADLIGLVAARAGVARLLEEGRPRLSVAGLSLGIAAAQAIVEFDAALRMALRARPTDAPCVHEANEERLEAAAEALAEICAALFALRFGAHQ